MQQYDNYEKKIEKVASVLSRILRRLPLIIPLLCVMIIGTSALLVAKGNVGIPSMPEQLTYGDGIAPKANAFLSFVRYEYRAVGSAEWTETVPTLPGSYEVRAVANGSFGKIKYSDAVSFAIAPKAVDVRVVGSVVYGETPTPVCDLALGDRLVCESFTFDNILADETAVTPVASSIKVLNENGNDVSSAYVFNAVSTMVRIQPRPITVTVEDASKIYDGMELTFDGYELTSGTLAANDELVAVIEGSLTDVGVIKNAKAQIRIVTKDGKDATHKYQVAKQIGTLSVEKRPLIIKTPDDTITYDGTDHVYFDYELSGSTSFARQHYATISWHTTVNHAGSYNNGLGLQIYDYAGIDKTENYSVFYVYGKITVEKKDVVVKTTSESWIYDGKLNRGNVESVGELAYQQDWELYISDSIINVGTKRNESSIKIKNIYSKIDLTENYNILYDYGTLEVTPRPVTVATTDYYAQYDGENHSSLTYTVTSELGFASTDRFEIVSGTSGTDVVDRVNEIYQYRVTNQVVGNVAYGTDVSSNYTITVENTGRFCIYPRSIDIKPLDVRAVYDSKPHSATEIELVNSTELVYPHTVSAEIIGTLTDAGETETYIVEGSVRIIDGNGKDVTYNYDPVIYSNGYIFVERRVIYVMTMPASKIYDGTTLTRHEFTLYVPDEDTGLLNGHEMSLNGAFTGEQTSVGVSDNTIDPDKAIITTSSGVDMSENYQVEVAVAGKLEVIPWAVITVTTESAQKQYDGTPLTNGEYTVEYSSGELDADHALSVIVTGSRTEVGVSRNSVKVSLTNGEGEDVSPCYTVIEIYGKLEVYGSKDTNVTVATVNTDKGGRVYLRQDSYGKYTGSTDWGGVPAYSTLLPGGYNCNYLTSFALKNVGAISQRASVELLLEDYMLPYYLAPTGSYNTPLLDTHYTYTVPSSSRYSIEYYLLTDEALEDVYSLRGNLGEYESYELAYREYVYANYTDIPQSTREYMNSVIAEQGFSLNDGGVIYKIASFIRGRAEYDLEYDTALDYSGDVAVEFLRTYKSGVCRHYATSATMLYRALGIPARYVTGYTVVTDAGETTEVTTPGHAWVEVYIDGVGWIQVEVTGGSEFGGDGNNSSGSLRIIPAYQSKVYDGEALVAESELEHTLALEKLLREGYTYEVTVTGACTEVGTGTSTVTSFALYDKNGNDVTEEFDIEYVDGVIEVLPSERKAITVLLYQLQHVYDGEAFAFREGDWEVLDLEDGLTLHMDIDISLTNVGMLTLGMINAYRDRYVTYTVLDREGRDVTSSYMIVFDASYADGTVYVPITVDKRAIELTAASESKFYDEKELSNSGFALTMGTLVGGHTVSAVSRGSITDVGTTANEIDPITVIIVDEYGNDVTHNYGITTKRGLLEIIEPEEEY